MTKIAKISLRRHTRHCAETACYGQVANTLHFLLRKSGINFLERHALAKARDWRQILGGAYFKFSSKICMWGICRHFLACNWQCGGVCDTTLTTWESDGDENHKPNLKTKFTGIPMSWCLSSLKWLTEHNYPEKINYPEMLNEKMSFIQNLLWVVKI
ncbi:hypothetical protein LJC68_09600 [Bacteroidales bacterium OttesenSCG-928-B11]|nr:hypothetical protein [Bacteroidales bacterium OttesenSCG-928-B11]